MSFCKSCGRPGLQDFPVSKSTLAFDIETGQQLPGGNDMWICAIEACKEQSCNGCYMSHIESKHLCAYSASCKSCSVTTSYKDFVEYGICRDCVEKRSKENVNEAST